jgi:uncharacterized protein (TIGR02001 family)
MKLHRLHVRVLLVGAVVCAAPVTACVAEGSWTAGLSATSDYVLRGVSQTDSNPALQGTIVYESEGGWYAGVWGSSLDKSEWYYPAGTANVEIDAFAGRRMPIDEAWSGDLKLVRYVYPGDGDVIDYDYTEVEASLSYRDFVRASVAWSPDASMVTQQGLMENEHTIAYELALQHPILDWLDVTAGVGYRDLPTLESSGYSYWSVGLTARRGSFSLDLARFGTDADGRALFGSHLAGDRTVVSLGWTF